MTRSLYSTLSLRTVPALLTWLAVILFGPAPAAQKPGAALPVPKAEVFYFHPTERCPIDQSIEETTRNMMRTDFAKEIKAGTLKFQVVNTDDKAGAKIAAGFDINSQALYLVTKAGGKEVKKDLTEFAFSTCQSNPAKFKTMLKQEILDALKLPDPSHR
jgi:hypothetical protein